MEINSNINNALSNINVPEHHFTYDSLAFTWRDQTITLYNPTIQPIREKTGKWQISIAVKKVKGHFNIFSLAFSKAAISIKDLTVSNPQCTLIFEKDTLNHASSTSQHKPTTKPIKIIGITLERGTLMASYILPNGDSIQADAGEIHFTGGTHTLTPKNISHLIDGLVGKSDTHLKMKNLRYQNSGGDYHFKLETVDYQGQSNTLKVNNLEVIPKHTREEYFNHYGYQKDFINARLDSLSIEHIRPVKNPAKTKINAGRLTVYQPELRVFRDRRWPEPPPKRRELPWLRLQKLPFRIHLDTLLIKKAYINYREKAPGSATTGNLVFARTYATIHNFTNDSINFSKNGQMKASINSRLMSKGELDIHGKFNLNSPTGHHEIRGKLGPFALQDINPVLEPLTDFTAEEGTNQSLTFNIQASRDYAQGHINFRYKDLKIGMVNPKNQEKRILKSALANTFAIKSHNPMPGDTVREFDYQFPRNKNKSVFQFWWKTLLEGLKKSAGVEGILKEEK